VRITTIPDLNDDTKLTDICSSFSSDIDILSSETKKKVATFDCKWSRASHTLLASLLVPVDEWKQLRVGEKPAPEIN